MVSVLAVFVAWSTFNGGSGATAEGTGSSTNPSSYSSINAQQRFASVTGEVFSGNFSNRGDIWKGSLLLMQTHPWFDFDELSLSWLQPIVGYGPDLFRYTYLLVSVPLDAGLLPAEPDHAHNFFLNQGVEQGILGLLSSMGIFLAPFLVGGYQLIKRRLTYPDIYKLVLIGLLATLGGRLLEQMVGVTRVSDLMLFWVLLGVFAALPVVMQSPNTVTNEATASPVPHSERRRTRRSSRQFHEPKAYDWQFFSPGNSSLGSRRNLRADLGQGYQLPPGRHCGEKNCHSMPGCSLPSQTTPITSS